MPGNLPDFSHFIFIDLKHAFFVTLRFEVVGKILKSAASRSGSPK